MSFLAGGKRGDRKFLTAPTGTGKGMIQQAVLVELAARGVDTIFTAPNLDVCCGVYDKMKPAAGIWDLSDAKRQERCEAAGLYSIGRLLNLMMAGKVLPPKAWVDDESHHTVDNTHKAVYDLMGRPPAVGFSATFYRGTPQSTAQLRDFWGPAEALLTIRDAVKSGVMACPTWDVWPLVDDDQIDVVNGEFVVKQMDNMVKDALKEIVHRCGRFFDPGTNLWDRPTTIVFPSVAAAQAGYEHLNGFGLPAVLVTGSTGGRMDAFKSTIARETVLCQVRVVGEGTDLPLRRMIDLSPTMSPMLWMQRVGRITRPTDLPPEYIACCHNITRHGYLWHGMIPPAVMATIQKAWGKDKEPNRRHFARAIGLEGFGRFKPAMIPLADGTFGMMYALQNKGGTEQYAVFLHPCSEHPMYFSREQAAAKFNEDKGVSEREWRKPWVRLDAPFSDLAGCVSLACDPVTPKMQNWWRAAAKNYGLDRNATDLDRRTFAILPILRDTGVRNW